MRRIILFLLCIQLCFITKALTLDQRMASRHEISVGYGEQLWDACNPKGKMIGESYSRYSNQTVTGNIFVEYIYQVNKLISLGINVNFNGWKADYVKLEPIPVEPGTEHEVSPEIGQEEYYTYSFLPTIRFTYFDHPNVNIYSGLSIGATMFSYGKEILGMLALDVCAVGVAWGKNHWFANVEVGALCSSLLLVNFLPTRILSVGFGYRF